ncbi:hypothetical protein APS_1860 [Acetobacter pasteurianus subsp. pasteurianus LMG 1262 = NBRC 106471]|nr:hypothetical protein APS_1860 [Acetobacter pasteurianus subsp. pasteurianus LMG 1262 = NBRC 106471]
MHTANGAWAQRVSMCSKNKNRPQSKGGFYKQTICHSHQP